MKNLIFILLIIFLSGLTSNAQNQVKKESNVRLGLSFSTFGYYSVSEISYDENRSEYSLNSFYSFGISTFSKTKKMVQIESGFYYSYHIVNIDRTYPSPGYTMRERTAERIGLIEFPVNVRFDLPYFYASTGLMLDLQMNNTEIISEQTGIGFNTGLGVSYRFKCGALVYAGPIVYIHSILPIGKDKLGGISLKIGATFN